MSMFLGWAGLTLPVFIQQTSSSSHHRSQALRNHTSTTALFLDLFGSKCLHRRTIAARRKSFRHAARWPTHPQADGGLRSNPSAQNGAPGTTARHHALHDLVHLQVGVVETCFGVCVLGWPACDSAFGLCRRVGKGVELVALERTGEVASLLGRKGWVRVGDECSREWGGVERVVRGTREERFAWFSRGCC
jgi:hypothetical protein